MREVFFGSFVSFIICSMFICMYASQVEYNNKKIKNNLCSKICKNKIDYVSCTMSPIEDVINRVMVK